MKVKLRDKVPAVVGSGVLLTSGTGAAAYALVCQTTASPTQAGDDAPLDDNHAPIATRSPEPGDDHGIDPTALSPRQAHLRERPGRRDRRADHSGFPTGSSGSGPGRGADDATPHATASPDDRHSRSGGGAATTPAAAATRRATDDDQGVRQPAAAGQSRAPHLSRNALQPQGALVKKSLALTTLALLALPLAPPAHAQGSGGVIARGACSGGGATWKLKGKHDSGRIEMEYQVDSNNAGQRWAVRVTDNGAVVFSGTVATAGRSGSFSVQRRIANRAGNDTLTATAKYAGRTCSGRITV